MNQQSITSTSRANAGLLAAVLLLSATGLLFELTLTRIFSATIWYHYAFVAISVALFGWGLGGFLVYLLGAARLKVDAKVALIALSLLLALTLPLFMFGILRYPFSPERLNYYFLLSLLPFLAGGAALSLAFESCGADSNRLYFADLIGAALGTLLVPPVISLLGAETAVLATAILPATAAVLLGLSLPGNRPRWCLLMALIILLGNIGLTAWNHGTGVLTVRNAPQKALYKLLAENPQAQIDSDHWNSYSRITAVSGFDEFHLARLFIDSDAETSVLPWDGTPKTPAGARQWFRAFPFRMVREPQVLVIGPGGGTDVVMAIASGSPAVTAVEMNPLVIDCVRQLGGAAGNLYDHPRVHLVLEEGRNFIERTDQRFDLIVLGFVDSWASVSSGGLSLTENYLYTRDALEAYYDHLTDGGALAIIRWPVDVPRLVANSVSFLTRRGMAMGEIENHLLAVSAHEPRANAPADVETVFMLTRSPLTPDKVETLLGDHADAYPIHVPFRKSETPYQRLFAGEISFDRYTDSFNTLATPVEDNHPFYFATDKPRGIPPFMVHLFKLPVRVVLGFTILLLLAGRLFHFAAPAPRMIAYFSALGVGFIICEVALIQRLILLLGHPLYTLVVILFTLLAAGGLGSLFARRYAVHDIRRALGWIIPLIILLQLLAAFVLPVVVRGALPLGLSTRILVAALLVFPFGFLMGMPFPLGLRCSAQGTQRTPVSSLWGINGVASVVGSIGGVGLAVVAGFTWMFITGAACYAIALVARPR